MKIKVNETMFYDVFNAQRDSVSVEEKKRKA